MDGLLFLFNNPMHLKKQQSVLSRNFFSPISIHLVSVGAATFLHDTVLLCLLRLGQWEPKKQWYPGAQRHLSPAFHVQLFQPSLESWWQFPYLPNAILFGFLSHPNKRVLIYETLKEPRLLERKGDCWKKTTKVRMESTDGPHSVTEFAWKAACGYS